MSHGKVLPYFSILRYTYLYFVVEISVTDPSFTLRRRDRRREVVESRVFRRDVSPTETGWLSLIRLDR